MNIKNLAIQALFLCTILYSPAVLYSMQTEEVERGPRYVTMEIEYKQLPHYDLYSINSNEIQALLFKAGILKDQYRIIDNRLHPKNDYTQEEAKTIYDSLKEAYEESNPETKKRKISDISSSLSLSTSL